MKNPNYAAEQVRTRTRLIGRTAWEIGDIFRQLRSRMTPDEFRAWLAGVGGYSYRTALQLVRVAEVYPTADDVPTSVSAAYVLTGTDVPDKARKEAARRERKGEAITPSVAREIVAKHAPERVPLPPVLTPIGPTENVRKLSDAKEDNWHDFVRDEYRLRRRQITPETLAKRHPVYVAEAARRLASDRTFDPTTVLRDW
jgi:hypothetical protein